MLGLVALKALGLCRLEQTAMTAVLEVLLLLPEVGRGVAPLAVSQKQREMLALAEMVGPVQVRVTVAVVVRAGTLAMVELEETALQELNPQRVLVAVVAVEDQALVLLVAAV